MFVKRRGRGSGFVFSFLVHADFVARAFDIFYCKYSTEGKFLVLFVSLQKFVNDYRCMGNQVGAYVWCDLSIYSI